MRESLGVGNESLFAPQGQDWCPINATKIQVRDELKALGGAGVRNAKGQWIKRQYPLYLREPLRPTVEESCEAVLQALRAVAQSPGSDSDPHTAVIMFFDKLSGEPRLCVEQHDICHAANIDPEELRHHLAETTDLAVSPEVVKDPGKGRWEAATQRFFVKWD